jgi:hypothetical protein
MEIVGYRKSRARLVPFWWIPANTRGDNGRGWLGPPFGFSVLQTFSVPNVDCRSRKWKVTSRFLPLESVIVTGCTRQRLPEFSHAPRFHRAYRSSQLPNDTDRPPQRHQPPDHSREYRQRHATLPKNPSSQPGEGQPKPGLDPHRPRIITLKENPDLTPYEGPWVDLSHNVVLHLQTRCMFDAFYPRSQQTMVSREDW